MGRNKERENEKSSFLAAKAKTYREKAMRAVLSDLQILPGVQQGWCVLETNAEGDYYGK